MLLVNLHIQTIFIRCESRVLPTIHVSPPAYLSGSPCQLETLLSENSIWVLDFKYTPMYVLIQLAICILNSYLRRIFRNG